MKFKKGDRVKVKAWKKLLAHPIVGVDGNGDISELMAPYSFTRHMERYCKCTATVVAADEKKAEMVLQFDGEKKAEAFIFREWMLEPIEEDEPDTVTVYITEKD